jgi:hypothetical protein
MNCRRAMDSENLCRTLEARESLKNCLRVR